MRDLTFLAGIVCVFCQFATSATAQSPCLVDQWVRTSPDGELYGEVVIPVAGEAAMPVAAANVSVIDAQSQVRSTTTNPQGSFAIPGISPGLYTLSVVSPSESAMYALHVVNPGGAAAEHFPERFTVSLASISGDTFLRASQQYLGNGGTSGQSDWSTWGEDDLIALSEIVCPTRPYRVASSDGGLTGKIHLPGASRAGLRPAGSVNVLLFSNSSEVARTITTADGRFRIEELRPGRYSLLAVGSPGIALVGFELVGDARPGSTFSSVDSNSSFVSTRKPGESKPVALVRQSGDGAADSMAVQLAPAAGGAVVLDQMNGLIASDELIAADQLEQGFGTPLAGGGGGFGSGGGGGGGLGGLGGIAALAGIGAIIAAVADDDDDDGGIQTPPVPISPSLP